MKNKIIFLFLTVFVSLNLGAQSITALFQGTMAAGSSANAVMLKIRPNETFSGQITNVQFTVQIPNTVLPQPTVTIKNNPLSAFVPTGNYLNQVTNEGGFYTYLFAATTLGSPVFSFTNGVEVNALELQFNNSTLNTTAVRFAHLANGGSTSQLAFYIEVSGFENVNYASMFYGPGSVNGGSYGSYSFVPIASIALPVKFTAFDLLKKDNNAYISWAVENETAITDHYEVERSLDGIAFEKIILLPKAANGSSNNLYNVVDKNLSTIKSSGIIYYRIKQVDANGQYVYSEIKNIRVSEKNININAYPNPVRDISTIEIDSPTQQDIVMNLLNAEGKMVQTITMKAVKGINIKKINMNNYAAGSYLLKIIMNGDVQTIKIIKE